MQDISSPNLGPFVILQLAVGIGFVASVIWAWIKGSRAQSPYVASESRIFLDGPIKVVLDNLAGTYRVLDEMRKDNLETVREFRQRHETEMLTLIEIKNLLERIHDKD